MKIKLRLLLGLLSASALAATPLTKSTAVHARPDASSPAITVLTAGTEAPIAAVQPTGTPKGWTAVELPGPFEAYLHNKDLTKGLDVRPGAAFHTSPKVDSPVLTMMVPGDSVEITGLHGKWTQVRIRKTITGYIHGDFSLVAQAATTIPATQVASAPRPTPAPFSPAPIAPAAYAVGGTGGTGQAVQMVNLGDGGSTALPRLFQGQFVSSRRLMAPRRPYDYQLNNIAGERYSYLDVSRLLQTEQIEKYVDHTVVVYGTAKPVEGTKDIVIEVESLQLH